MKTSALSTLLKFLAVTLPLTWWWLSGGREAYWEHVYKPFAFPVLGWLSVTTFPPSVVRDRLMNFLPFLALMVSTPRMPIAVRAKRTLIGLGLIFVGQIALGYWAYVAYEGRGPENESAATFFPAVVASDALPFALWTLMAREFVSSLLASVLPPAPGQPARERPEPERRAAVEAEPVHEDESERPPEAG